MEWGRIIRGRCDWMKQSPWIDEYDDDDNDKEFRGDWIIRL